MLCVKSNNYKTNSIIILGLIFIIIGSVSSVFLIIRDCIHTYKYPSAIDVYRGKTILQITYKNNVPIDTTVVYK
jgi:hypothetical protein